MAFDYTGLAQAAQELVEDFGRDVTLVKVSETPADPNAPWDGNTSAETTNTIAAVLFDYEKEDIDGELIRAGDQQAVTAELSDRGVDFQDYELLRDDEGQEWKIVDVDKIRPGPTTIAFLFQLRK
jgi:hypothetical protein